MNTDLLGCCMGEDVIIQTRPPMVVETTDPQGNVISRTETPGETKRVTLPSSKPKDKTLPVLAAIAAAYLLLS